jgi:hypothetical protein
MWLYYVSGGSGLQLTPRKNDQHDVNEPVVSPDGRYVYFSEDMYPSGFFQYNKDPNKQIFVIKRFDREKGITENVTGGPGDAMRPLANWLICWYWIKTRWIISVTRKQYAIQW